MRPGELKKKFRAECEAVIRQKCIEANPEILRPVVSYSEKEGRDIEVRKVARPIRLADVLLAMKLKVEARHETFQQAQAEWSLLLSTGPLWNLRKDDLTEQSDETISFLYDLLK